MKVKILSHQYNKLYSRRRQTFLTCLLLSFATFQSKLSVVSTCTKHSSQTVDYRQSSSCGWLPPQAGYGSFHPQFGSSGKNDIIWTPGNRRHKCIHLRCQKESLGSGEEQLYTDDVKPRAYSAYLYLMSLQHVSNKLGRSAELRVAHQADHHLGQVLVDINSHRIIIFRWLHCKMNRILLFYSEM